MINDANFTYNLCHLIVSSLFLIKVTSEPEFVDWNFWWKHLHFTFYFGSLGKLWYWFSINSLYYLWFPFRILFAIYKLGCEGPNSRIILWQFPWEMWIQLSRELDKRRILHLINMLYCLLFFRFSIFTRFFLSFSFTWFYSMCKLISCFDLMHYSP